MIVEKVSRGPPYSGTPLTLLKLPLSEVGELRIGGFQVSDSVGALPINGVNLGATLEEAAKGPILKLFEHWVALSPYLRAFVHLENTASRLNNRLAWLNKCVYLTQLRGRLNSYVTYLSDGEVV